MPHDWYANGVNLRGSRRGSSCVSGSRAPVSLGADEARQLRVPGFLVSDLRFPSGLKLPPHSHDRATVAVIVRGGFDGWWDGCEATCEPGTLVVEPAGERHANAFVASGATRVATVQPDDDRPELLRARSRRSSRRPDSMPIALRLLDELASPDDVAPIALEGLALELSAVAARRDLARPRPSGWLRRATEMVEEHRGRPLSLAVLADEVGVDPSHLARAFRAHHGRSVGTYLRERRVRRAARMLARGHRSIAEVALAVGFVDQSHLTRWFVRYLGVTPARFRSIARDD